MIYAYIRISKDTQNIKNQKYEILKFVDEKKLHVDKWLQETVSGTKNISDRKLGYLLQTMGKDDILITTELSRLGRSLMEIMSILNDCMNRDIKVFTTKEHYELGNNINSKVLAFAFGLSAEIERNLISQRTKEALYRVKAEGRILGRPKGSLAKITKLTGKEKIIKELLTKEISVAAIGRILGVHRLTADSFIKSRKIQIND